MLVCMYIAFALSLSLTLHSLFIVHCASSNYYFSFIRFLPSLLLTYVVIVVKVLVLVGTVLFVHFMR